jgi:hypothetical protein
MVLRALHVAYVRSGAGRESEPHLTQILTGLGARTICGRPVLGYGEMLPDNPIEWPDQPPLCDDCRRQALAP